MPNTQDTAMNLDNEFVFKVDEDTPQQVVNALDDFTTFMDLFEVRSREYGDGAAFFLGSKGQFSDIYRKIIKLKTALWDGRPEQLTSEGTEEVIYDLLGHLFLTLQCLRLENRKTVVNPIFRGGTPKEILEEILEGSEAFKRLAFDPATVARMNDKRKLVRTLYPQISAASLDARNEESLDWLISAAKPVPATGAWSVDPVGHVDGRDWWYDKGDKVTTSPGDWLDGRTGHVLKRNLEDAGIWYTVDFGDNAHGLTCSQDSLSIVARSQAWYDNQKTPGRGEPTLVADVERKIAPRKLKDAPQA